jgi:RHS repeat-associated protein
VYVNQLVILDGRASSDPEAEALTFSWTEDATNPASGLLQGAHAPQPGITPTIAGTYGFHLTVSDGVNTSAPAAVTVTVQAGIPPTQTLTSTATSATSGYTWTNGTRQFSADLFTGKSGSTAYDGVAQFVLPTTPAGLVLSSAALDLTGKSSTSPTVNDAWIVALLPTSVDGTWTTLTWAMINGATPDATLTPILTGLNQVVANVVNHWDFTSADLAVVQSRLTGSGKLSIRTQGNGASSSASVRWYGGNATNATQRPKLTLVFTPVPQTDHAPIARAGADQRVAPGALVTLQGQDSYDYEGAVASFAWTQIGGAAVTLSAPTDAAPIFTPPAAGTYRFQLVVTDAASQASASDEVVVSVATPPPHVTSYVYDGEGDRIAQTNDGVTTSYVVNSLPKLGEVLAETTSDETTLYVYGQDLLYTLTSTGPHYHHTDGLGSTIAVTNAAGTVEQTMDYDVFGTLRSMTGSSGTTRTFTGEENDAAGLVYLRARFYDPSVGRFLSRDPFPAQATDTQTLNRYVYVKNNPTNYVDPSGESAEEAFRDILWWLLAPTQTADESVCELPTPGEYQNAVTSGSRLGILIGGAAGLRLLVRGTLAFKASFNYALQPSKLGHIFGNSDHLLDPLVKQLGGQQQVVKEVLVQLPSLPKGVFEGVRVMVNDTTVVVSGYVDDGIVKIGTMYVPR